MWSVAVESLLREMKRRPAPDSADGRAERPATPRSVTARIAAARALGQPEPCNPDTIEDGTCPGTFSFTYGGVSAAAPRHMPRIPRVSRRMRARN